LPDAIQVPRLGRLRLKERGYLPVAGRSGVRVLSATVSEQAGHWSVFIQVEQEQDREQDQDVPAHPGPALGGDLGIKKPATRSDATVIPNPKPREAPPQDTQALPSGGHPQAERPERLQEPPEGGASSGPPLRQDRPRAAGHLQQLTTALANTTSVVVI